MTTRALALRAVTNLTGSLPDRQQHGTLPLTGQFAAASPMTHVSAKSAAFLIYQADNDSVVLKTSAPLMAKRLDAAGVANRLVTRQTGGREPRYDLDEIDAWFREHLK